MSKHPENRAFRLKMKFAFSLWERRDLSDAARMVFSVLLLRHHNNKTGKCNPSYRRSLRNAGKDAKASSDPSPC